MIPAKRDSHPLMDATCHASERIRIETQLVSRFQSIGITDYARIKS